MDVGELKVNLLLKYPIFLVKQPIPPHNILRDIQSSAETGQLAFTHGKILRMALKNKIHLTFHRNLLCKSKMRKQPSPEENSPTKLKAELSSGEK